MNLQDRHRATATFFRDCQLVLERKGVDYTSNADSFALDRQAARISDVPLEEHLLSMLAKHIAGLSIAIRQSNIDNIVHRAIDSANYLALIAVHINHEAGIPPCALES